MDLTSKQAIRKHIRQQRREISAQQQQASALALQQQINELNLISDESVIAAYISNDGELSPHCLIETLWQSSTKVTLPVVHPFTAGHLLFLSYKPQTTMVNNQYGIPEPQLDVTSVMPIDEVDIVFMPLVAFDKKGNRLGMGGGYYDRTLARKRKSQLFIGLAHDVQELPDLPTEPWDVPLDMIVTPTQVIR